MVTPTAEHDATDLDNESIMPFPISRLTILAIAFGMAAPLAAQPAGTAADGDAGRKPLNLSLPREAIFPPGSMIRQDPTLRDNFRAPPRQDEAPDKATPDRTRGEPNGAFDAPYGTGFEARQRGLGSRGGGGMGGGGFGGGGRGKGRGR